MGIYINGLELPIYGHFYFNGTDIANIVKDTVNVWKQQLFSATWSGSSLSYGNGTNGMEMSGNLTRARGNNAAAGAWIAVGNNGIFTSVNTVSTTCCWSQFSYSGNINELAGLPFIIGQGFTGTYIYSTITVSQPYYGNYYQRVDTSNGLLRYSSTGVYSGNGAWVSLT